MREPGGKDARALAEEFDAAFARRAVAPSPSVALLAFRAANQPLAVRVLDAAGMVALRQVVPVPSRRPEVLGVAGLRGDLVPVFGLARLVLRRDDEAPRWMLLAGTGAERVGFAFSAFEGHLVVPASSLHAAPAEPGVHHVHALYTGSPSRPVLDLPSLVAAATAR